MANQIPQPDTALHNTSHLMQYHDLIESIVAALDARDAYTANHSDRVADMVLVLAAALGLDEDETTRIHMAAHLHDIGKIAVPDSVLRKAGPLTRPEWEEMRRHPVTGYEILRKIDDFKEIAILVRHHHERWDGRGYPDGLSGHDIPPGSRVIAVADSIDAMMSSRSYRPAMTSAACRREIEKNSGIMYDPRVAAAALEHWDELVSRYAGADTPRTPYFDRLQLEHTRQAHDYLLTHQGSRITLPELQEKVQDKIFIVPRLYTNKPRTIGVGYKGMLHQPSPEGEEDMLGGIIAIRKMNVRVVEETGLTGAEEILYPEVFRYLSDLLSYAAVGARSSEDQLHRMIASGVGIPVGMKNPTSGDLSVMLNSVAAAQHEQEFLFRGWEVRTKGNPLAHSILRGYVDPIGNSFPKRKKS